MEKQEILEKIDIEKMLRNGIEKLKDEIKEGRESNMKFWLNTLKNLDAIEKESPNLSTITIKEMREDAKKHINRLKEEMKDE